MSINISEIIENWPDYGGGWRYAPATLDWVSENARIKCGENVHIQNGVRLSDLCRIGDEVFICRNVVVGTCVTIGNNVRIGDNVRLGHGVILGDSVALCYYVTLGAHCSIGCRTLVSHNTALPDRTFIGDNAYVGPYTVGAIDLGHVDDYRKVLCFVGPDDREPYIGAGCRWYTLTHALVHWSPHNHPYDRRRTFALCEYAQKLATLDKENRNV